MGQRCSGGATMVFSDKNAAENDTVAPILEIAHVHLRQILGPFQTSYHGARDWKGWRACMGCYVDGRILNFFHSFKLSKKNGIEFEPRSKEETMKNFAAFVKCSKELGTQIKAREL